MKLSAMIAAYAARPLVKARLKKGMRLYDVKVFRKVTVSDLLIDKGDGTYYFEAKHSAATVTADEVEIISPLR
jgi:hypothetical protein